MLLGYPARNSAELSMMSPELLWPTSSIRPRTPTAGSDVSYYPNTPSIESDFFGLSQVLAQAASNAFTDPNLRRELAAAGVTRSDLLLQTIRMIQIFLSQSPTNPMADEASLALVGAFLELENYF
jgi:hypothetical protein